MQEVISPLLTLVEDFALCYFVFMMWESQVYAAGVNVQLASKHLTAGQRARTCEQPPQQTPYLTLIPSSPPHTIKYVSAQLHIDLLGLQWGAGTNCRGCQNPGEAQGCLRTGRVVPPSQLAEGLLLRQQ